MTKTIGTMFSGGELFGIGSKQAGYEHSWGIEKEEKIAKVARINGFNVYTASVLDFVPYKTDKQGIGLMKNKNTGEILGFVSHLHASPECKNASNAKTKGGETPLDLEMSGAVCEFIRTLRPETFSLENVVNYKNFQSFKNIIKTLSDCGYFYDAQSLNAADFGVPQSRRRLFIRASRISLLRSYPPKVKHIGWYEAIEDLIPTLPDAKFAQWQLDRLPEKYMTLMTQATSYNPKTTRGAIYRTASEPASTVLVQNSSMKAFIADGQSNYFGRSITVPDGDAPMFTIMASVEKKPLKAFVVSSGNSNHETFQPKDDSEPHHTITANMEKTPSRIFIVDTRQTIRKFTVRQKMQSATTLAASSGGNRSIAYLNGVVKKLDIRALGRLQTVPDDYIGLTPLINGNGVPCKLAKVIMETFG